MGQRLVSKFLQAALDQVLEITSNANIRTNKF